MSSFPDAARSALADAQLRANLGNATSTIRDKRARVVAELPDWEELREAGRAIKADVLAHLDEYLVRFEETVDGGRRAGALGRRRGRGEPDRARRRAGARRRRGREGQVADDRRDRAQRRARRGRRARDRDRLRRADPAARRRLVVAHPRAGDPPQPDRDPRPLPAHDRRPVDLRRPAGAGRGVPPLPAREVPRRAHGGERGQLRRRRDGHGVRRRVRGKRPHVHDAAARARDDPRDREARADASPISRSSCSSCRARRPASG